MMSNSAAGVLTKASAGATSQLVIRGAGNSPGTPGQWNFGPTAPFHPDYSMSALQGMTPSAQGFGFTDVDLTSVSTSQLMPFVNGAGSLDPGPYWFALDVAVGPNTTGVPGSVLEAVNTALPGTIERTVFGYYAAGSSGVAASLEGEVTIEQLSSQLGIPASDRVAGLDWAIGVTSTFPAGTPPMFKPTKELYFTVSSNWVDQRAAASTLPQVKDPAAGSFVDMNTASIYVTTWRQASQVWSTPTVFFSNSDLGLQSGNTSTMRDEIDGLAVYSSLRGGDLYNQVIFSLRPTALSTQNDQILVNFRLRTGGIWATISPTQPLKDRNGTPVSSVLGVRTRANSGGGDPDDVSGICIRDPEGPTLSRLLATPKYDRPDSSSGFYLSSLNLGLSLARVGVPSSATIDIDVTGDLGLLRVGGTVYLCAANTSVGSAGNPLPLSSFAFLSTVAVPPGADVAQWSSGTLNLSATGAVAEMHVFALFLSNNGDVIQSPVSVMEL